MKVILTKDVKSQGKKGDLINVSDGYANNFLLPKGLAVPATKQAVNELEGKKGAEQIPEFLHTDPPLIFCRFIIRCFPAYCKREIHMRPQAETPCPDGPFLFC